MNAGKKILWFLTGMLWGIILCFGAGVLYLRENLITEKECTLSYEETVCRFPEQVAKHGSWTVKTLPCGLPAQIKGSRITVFEICSREHAVPILTDPASRKTAAVLPCRFAVYEKEGKVWVASLNNKLFMRLEGGTAARVFVDAILPEQQRMLHGLLK